jgi:predicted MFS family arabinose efflux permease
VWSLAVVMVIAGSATAPMLITGLSLAQRLVPPALVTEGLAVAITGILIGISAGSAVGGWAVEAWGAQAAYAVPVGAGTIAVGIILASYRRLLSAERSGAGRGTTGPRPTPLVEPGLTA